MKVVIITVDDAKKTGLGGAEKLAKNDYLILMSAKNKTEMPAVVKEALEAVKAEVEYVKLEANQDVTAAYAYYAGFHNGRGHQTFIVAPDKTKLPSVVAKQVKIYTSFASVLKAESSTTRTSNTTKTSTKASSSNKNSSSKSGSKTSGTLADTISSLTGLSKTDSKKLVNAASDLLKSKKED